VYTRRATLGRQLTQPCASPSTCASESPFSPFAVLQCSSSTVWELRASPYGLHQSALTVNVFARMHQRELAVFSALLNMQVEAGTWEETRNFAKLLAGWAARKGPQG
jgi:hypothetical protein